MIRRDTFWLMTLLSLIAVMMVGCSGDDEDADAGGKSAPIGEQEVPEDHLLVSLELPGMV
jgi:hypothetical protein